VDAAFGFALQLNALTAVSLAALGLAVGLLSGLFGVGGGFLLTPMLNVFLGVPYDLAVGSTLVQMALMAWVGMVQHLKQGHVDVKLAMSLLAGSFFGAEAGVRFQGALKALERFELNGALVSGFDIAMSGLFIALLGFIGTGMVLEGTRSRRRALAAGAAVASGTGRDEAAAARDVDRLEPEASALSRFLAGVRVRPTLAYSSDPARRFSFWVPAGVGFVVGTLTGLLGTGGGVINMPILIYVLGMPTVVAVGTASLQTTIVSIYSGARHLMLGNVLWPVVACVLLGSLAGVRTGALLSSRIPKDRLRLAFGWVVLGTAFIVVLDVLRKLA